MSNTVPEGWKVIPFEVVFTEIKNGCSLDQNGSGNGLPVTRIETISNGKIDYSKTGWLYTTQDIERFRIDKGDILFSHINSLKHIGKTAIKDDDRLLYHGMNLLRFKIDRSKFSPTYLQNLLSWEVVREDMRKKAKQAINQASLNVQDIKTTAYPIPPLPEQQKIAAILSSVDDVIEKTRAQIDKLKDLKTGMMQELLTKGIGSGGVPHTEFKDSPLGRLPACWSVIELKQIATVKGGKRMPKGKPFAGHVTPYPYIRVSDLGNGTIRQDNLKYVLPKDREAIKRYTISKNDLYISIAGTIGMVGSVPEALDGAQLTENAAKIVFYDLQTLCPSFVKHVLTSGEVQERLNQEKGTGGGVPKLALFRIESTQLPMPPLSEQRSIGKALDSMDQRLAVTHEKLNALMICKKALMQDLLTGKVRVNVTEKEAAIA